MTVPKTALRTLYGTAACPNRAFHGSARAFIKVGDPIPDVNVLVEKSPGNKVKLSEQLTGKGLIIGVPAAFSKFPSHGVEVFVLAGRCQWRWPLLTSEAGPSCSATHIPGYINHKNLKDAGDVFVIAVNDPFV